MWRHLLPAFCLLSLWGAPLRRTEAAPRAIDAGAPENLALPSEEAQAAAERHGQLATDAYAERSYRRALREILMAYGLSRQADLLLRAAAASEGLGRPDEAALFLGRYLQERPVARDKLSVLSEIERLKKLPVAPAASGAVAADLAPPAAQRPAGRGLLLGAAGLGAAGVVLLVTGLALNGAALRISHDLESAPRFDTDLFGQGRSLDAAGITADVVGAAALLAGAVLGGTWYARRSQRVDAPPLVLRPAGPGLAISGVF